MDRDYIGSNFKGKGGGIIFIDNEAMAQSLRIFIKAKIKKEIIVPGRDNNVTRRYFRLKVKNLCEAYQFIDNELKTIILGAIYENKEIEII